MVVDPGEDLARNVFTFFPFTQQELFPAPAGTSQ